MARGPLWAEFSEKLEDFKNAEKNARVLLLQGQRCAFFALKLAVPQTLTFTAPSIQEAAHNAMKSRHAAFEARLEAKQATDHRLHLDMSFAAETLVEAVVTEAFQAVWSEALQRDLWQLKEVEDQERQALVDEEESMRRLNGLAVGGTAARRALHLHRAELSRKYAQRAMQAEREERLSKDFAIQMWDLNAEEAAARRQIMAEERLAMAKARHSELQAFKAQTTRPSAIRQPEPTFNSVAFISDMVGAVEVFTAQRQQQSRLLANRLKAEEAAKRQLQMQRFASERSAMLKQMLVAEAKLLDACAAHRVAAAHRAAALERATAQLVHAALRQAVAEAAAEARARDMSPPKRGTSLRLRPEVVREVAEQHAVTVSPVKAAPPAPPPQAVRPGEARPEKTGRRVFIRRQGERLRKQREEAAGGLWSAKDLSLLRKQQAVGRTMVNPNALTLPPIVSPFNVQAPLLT
eukprot:EG_transcript_9235